MQLILISNSASIAAFACACGVDWIMVDLETIGKFERQGHLDTVMNSHNVEDVHLIRGFVPSGRLLVRTNPVHDGTFREVEAVLGAGADALMLPWFHTAAEVSEYARIVDGRAQIWLLAETKRAVAELRECCAIDGVNRVHIGLNDLSLEFGHRFMFELLIDGTIDKMAAELKAAKMPFGIGGVARVGEGMLPAERILVEHVRHGSDAAILSRTFHRNADTVEAIELQMDFAGEINNLREVCRTARLMSEKDFADNLDEVASAVNQVRDWLPERKAFQKSHLQSSNTGIDS